MRIFFFLVLFTVLGVSLKAQYIIAGQHTAADYYVDIPDTALHVTPYTSPQFPIDINGDGTEDYDITVKWAQSQASKLYYIALNARNGNQIAFDRFDSCSSSGQPVLGNDPMARSFMINDTIGPNNAWQYYAVQYLSYSSFVGWGPTYTSCNGGLFSDTSSFLGVRVFLTGDTIYGWVKVSIGGTSNCTIYEYACNSLNSGISVIDAAALATIFPNPVSTFLTVEFNSKVPPGKVQMEVFNMLGKIVYKTELPSNQKNQIDLSEIGKGLYTVHLYDGDSSIKRKLVKR